MCEYTGTIRVAVESIDHATMERPAVDCRGGDRCDPIFVVAAQHGIRVHTTAERNDDDGSGTATDGGQVVIEDASGSISDTNMERIDESTSADSMIAPRTRRAHEEEMDVSLFRKGGIYEVRSESGNVYEVDVADGSCTCLDWQRREPEDGCKHLRRADMAIKAGIVPRPDGRIPERTVTTDGDRNSTFVVDVSRIAARTHRP